MVRWTQSIPFAIVFLVFLYAVHFYNTHQSDTELKLKILENWSECAQRQLNKYNTAEEFWVNFASLTGNCDFNEHIEQLNLIQLKNDDEIKFAILPNGRTKNTTTTFVTLGIGKDISAERLFRNELEMRGHSVNFSGADPITDENGPLYSQIGEYFPFAIGSKAGVSDASVFKNGTYKKQKVIHVELIYFLKEILQVTDIDHLWLDAEGAEYGLFDYFYNDGPLERNGIYFCQMNLEVHIGDADRKIRFMKFAKRLALEKRFVMLRALYYTHVRLFLFNFANPKCVQKYL